MERCEGIEDKFLSVSIIHSLFFIRALMETDPEEHRLNYERYRTLVMIDYSGGQSINYLLPRVHRKQIFQDALWVRWSHHYVLAQRSFSLVLLHLPTKDVQNFTCPSVK